MTKELREKLAALRAVAPRLNAETDEAAKVVQAVEAFLAGLSLGVPAEVMFDDETVHAESGDDARSQTDREFYFAYRRCYGEFRLCVVEMEATTDNRTADCPDWVRTVATETPWSSCSREIKLRSFAVLPRLLSVIADEANRLADTAAETSKTVHELVTSLGADEFATAATVRPMGGSTEPRTAGVPRRPAPPTAD